MKHKKHQILNFPFNLLLVFNLLLASALTGFFMLNNSDAYSQNVRAGNWDIFWNEQFKGPDMQDCPFLEQITGFSQVPIEVSISEQDRSTPTDQKPSLDSSTDLSSENPPSVSSTDSGSKFSDLLGIYDTDIFEVTGWQLLKGALPKSQDEILVTPKFLGIHNLPWQTGISIQIQDEQPNADSFSSNPKFYTVSGILSTRSLAVLDLPSLWMSADQIASDSSAADQNLAMNNIERFLFGKALPGTEEMLQQLVNRYSQLIPEPNPSSVTAGLSLPAIQSGILIIDILGSMSLLLFWKSHNQFQIQRLFSRGFSFANAWIWLEKQMILPLLFTLPILSLSLFAGGFFWTLQGIGI